MNDNTPQAFSARKAAAAAPQLMGPADCSATARLLADAFWTDPVPDFFRRKDRQERAAHDRFFAFATARYGLIGGETWLARDPAAGSALAAALWIAPPLDALDMGIWEQARLAPLMVSITGLWGLQRMFELRAAMDAQHPSEPHYYLFFLGVAPEYQGQGLGSALLGANLARIDSVKQAAYLEASTPRNRDLYLRHGFEVRAEFQVGRSGPLLWSMWRPARK